jgi:hypothetical protein
VSRLRGSARGPLGVAGILCVPLYLSALMVTSLWLERFPHLPKGGYGQPTGGNEAGIYAAALVPVAVVMAVALLLVLAPVAARVRIALVCVAAVIVAWVVTLRVDQWARDHTRRIPIGTDRVPDSDPSNIVLKGEWEGTAKHTAESLRDWTTGLAIACVLILVLLEVLRRRGVASAHQVDVGGPGEQRLQMVELDQASQRRRSTR